VRARARASRLPSRLPPSPMTFSTPAAHARCSTDWCKQGDGHNTHADAGEGGIRSARTGRMAKGVPGASWLPFQLLASEWHQTVH